MKSTLPAPTTQTLRVPGAKLTYDIRRNEDSTEPPLFLIGSPMGAAGFGSLIGYLPDRTIITYDPRGSERSTKPDMSSPSAPDEHADDLHRIIQEVGGGPIDMFASSGGATNALALVAKHPHDVRTLVGHEPPMAAVLPDRENAQAASRAIYDTYQSKGFGAGMAHFIAVVSHQGEFPDDFARRPVPDPATFGMPAEDDGSRTDPLMGQNILSGIAFEPDTDALRRASTRIVIAAGVESEGILPSRAAYAVAERLGTEVVLFPSGHGGFMGGEYGQPPGEPEAFAARLREVLEAKA